jgi:hypothetical protein
MKKMITLAAAAALLALSCGDEEGVTPQEPDRLAPASPAAVLENVEISFNQRNVDLLKAMLSTNFVFYFDPDDVGKNPPGKPNYEMPESWNRTEFLRAASNMFKKAYRISLSIETKNVGEPPPEATIYNAEKVTVELIVTVDELHGYITDQGYCNFAFERYESAPGKKHWRIKRWWDYTCAPKDEYSISIPTSFGRVLAIYY